MRLHLFQIREEFSGVGGRRGGAGGGGAPFLLLPLALLWVLEDGR